MKVANIKQNRFLTIAKTKEQIFHIDDLARIWQIDKRQNLIVSLNRYVKAGLIHRLYRGLYALKKAEALDPIELGLKALNNYAYLSTESVLAKHGVIFQHLQHYTFIGPKSRRLQIGSNHYYCRQLKDKYLFNDTGIIKNNPSFNEASVERAVADMLHYNPRYHFDNLSGIDHDKLREIQKKVYNK